MLLTYSELFRSFRVLSWYVNRVAKADYGQPLPWYFPCTLAYWCPGSVKAPPADDETAVVYDEGIAVEEVSNNLKDQAAAGKSIEIRKLRKVFGEKIAVDGLSMSMYSGQITALLGHNGVSIIPNIGFTFSFCFKVSSLHVSFHVM